MPSAIEYKLVCYVDDLARVWFDLPYGINGPRHAETFIEQLSNTARRKQYGIPVFKSGRVRFVLQRVETEEGGGYVWGPDALGIFAMHYRADAEKF